MEEKIKNIIESTSMGELEKEAVTKSLLDLHNFSKPVNRRGNRLVLAGVNAWGEEVWEARE